MEDNHRVVLIFICFYFIAWALGKIFPSRQRRSGDYSGGAGDGVTGVYDEGHSFFGFDGGDCGGHGGGDGGGGDCGGGGDGGGGGH